MCGVDLKPISECKLIVLALKVIADPSLDIEGVALLEKLGKSFQALVTIFLSIFQNETMIRINHIWTKYYY